MQKDCSLPHAGKCRDADVFAFVGEFGIDFVCDDQEIMLAREYCDVPKIVPGERGSGRVVWEIQDERLRFRCEMGFHQLARQPEPLFPRGLYRNRHAMAEGDNRAVGHVAWLVVDYFFAGIQYRTKGQIQRFAYTHRHEHLRFPVVRNVKGFVDVPRYGQPKLCQPEGRRISGCSFFQRKNRAFPDVPRRGGVRLAHAETDDVVHFADDVEKVPDAGPRDPLQGRGEEIMG